MQLARTIAVVTLLNCGSVTHAGVVRGDQKRPDSLPACGTLYKEPFGTKADATPRLCVAPTPRTYVPRYSGIGYDLLSSESEACFVPDELYLTLDQIVADAKREIKLVPTAEPSAKRRQAREVSATIGQILVDHGFTLYIPTDTLGDALVKRNGIGEAERHVVDCDTSSFIYLTVAENLGVHLSLIEMNLPSGNLHYFVRWDLAGGGSLDWDTNGRAECQAPPNLPAFQGKPMTAKQILGYERVLRAELWKRRQKWDNALDDFRLAAAAYPESPLVWNNLAWLVATRNVSDRDKIAAEALAAAQRSLSMVRTANSLDTLACVWALRGDYKAARQTEEDALRLDPGNTEYSDRLHRFLVSKDCTGLE